MERRGAPSFSEMTATQESLEKRFRDPEPTAGAGKEDHENKTVGEFEALGRHGDDVARAAGDEIAETAILFGKLDEDGPNDRSDLVDQWETISQTADLLERCASSFRAAAKKLTGIAKRAREDKDDLEYSMWPNADPDPCDPFDASARPVKRLRE